MKARDLMTPRPSVVTRDHHVSDAARIMRDIGVGSVPVVSDTASMRLEGVVTDRDLAVRCIASRHFRDCPITDHMTKTPLDMVDPDADIEEVMELMERDQVRRVMVIEGDRLVGIIAQADLALKEGQVAPLRVEEVLERVSAPSFKLE
jgi:CBS domain-containing protein